MANPYYGDSLYDLGRRKGFKEVKGTSPVVTPGVPDNLRDLVAQYGAAEAPISAGGIASYWSTPQGRAENELRQSLGPEWGTGYRQWDNFVANQLLQGRDPDAVAREASVGAKAQLEWDKQHAYTPGLFDKLIGGLSIGLSGFLGGPLVGALAGATFGEGTNPGGGMLGALSNAAGGALSGISNAEWDAFLHPSRGFVNPSALGLTGDMLSLPGLLNAPGAISIPGYGAGALGLSGANLALPGLFNSPVTSPIGGYGAGAIGKPSDLYNPEALGGMPDRQSPELSGAIKQGLGLLNQQQPQPARGFLPGAAVGGSAVGYVPPAIPLPPELRDYFKFNQSPFTRLV